MKKPTDTLPVNLQRRRLLCAASGLINSAPARNVKKRLPTMWLP